MGYIGEKYYGMQLNPGVITIEQVMLNALHRTGLVSDSNKGSLSKIGWMRSARTDKGVSAAGQCASVKLECEIDGRIDQELVKVLNLNLPPDVVVYGMMRTTAGFNARGDCHRRRYEYILPVRLLGGSNCVEDEKEEGQGDPRAWKLTQILKMYEGSHCFANFTEGLKGSDDTARRFMISLKCGQPFLPKNAGVYYVPIQIYGQSFLLHQIRKMVGLALLVYLGHAPKEVIQVALCPDIKFPTPTAPALGLLLDSPTFESYNKRHASVLQEPIGVDAFGDMKERFKLENIYRRIAEKERMDRTMEKWVRGCKGSLQFKMENIAQLHEKFILTNAGREEQRKAYIASLYPIVTSMEEFGDCPADEVFTLGEKIRDEFKERYGTEATFLARAPGRAILIGEHLDYNGLPVISIATSQGSLFAGCLDNTEDMQVCHMENDRYASGVIQKRGQKIEIAKDADEHLDTNWLKYVSWGVIGFQGALGSKSRTVKGGGRLLVGGNIPRGGGLASSSSLVTGCALVAARLNRKRVPKLELAEHAAKAESVGAGTKGGAVDHTTSVCGVKGNALYVSFLPHLGTTNLKLPDGMSLVAVGCGVKAEKGFDEKVKGLFNLRAAECRVGSAIVARRLDVHSYRTVTKPGQLLAQAMRTSRLECRSMSDLKEKSRSVLGLSECISVSALCKELDLSEIEVEKRFMVDAEAKELKIGRRMAHVYSETERVERFCQVLRSEDMSTALKIEALGDILNKGQESLRNLFESSCTEMDELVSYCRKHGAVGSRMTGAGWGGYTINIVRDEQMSEFMTKMREKVNDCAIIPITASRGACIYAIHNLFGKRTRPQTNEMHGTTPERKRRCSARAQRVQETDAGRDVEDLTEEGEQAKCMREARQSAEGRGNEHEENGLCTEKTHPETAEMHARDSDAGKEETRDKRAARDEEEREEMCVGTTAAREKQERMEATDKQ